MGRLHNQGSALIGGDVSGNARGNFAIDVQTTRVATTQVAGERAIAIGRENTAAGYRSIAIGVDNISKQNNCIAIGYNNVSGGTGATEDDYETVCIGVSNTADHNYAVAVGYRNNALEAEATAVGSWNNANVERSTALGFRARADVEWTTNICGPIINRKSEVSSDNLNFLYFPGVEVVLMTKEIDLKTLEIETITLKSGCSFWIREMGLVATEISGLVTQPTVEYGIVGNTNKHGVAAITTVLTATRKMEIETPLVPEDGETTLVGTITVVATATVAKGRFFWSGKLIEDEP